MTPAQWAQIRQIFESAIEQPPETRAAFVHARCDGDLSLRQEVEALLANHEQSGDFLNSPAAEIASVFGAMDDHSAEQPSILQAGPYKLERRIGRGGMGSVWLATRSDHAYERQVAIKMVKRGMDTSEILRQFRREREVLAGLDHPNIARLLDAGSSDDGTPYLVMEYVEGTPIDQYFARRQSSITERLELFLQVCSAVHYAHQNLVVHRDLKPGNILVSATGVPKLLDFGIAKLLTPDAGSDTRPELRAMTLDYASPEQVRGAPMNTSSDVYSLGVLLFKLLTGKLPYAPTNSRAELSRAICDLEPLKASAVVVSDDKTIIPQATQAIELGIETRDKARQRLRKKLRGDLDTILQQALAKEPLRRYLSVEQFSDDIRRYLEGRAVRARGDHAGYRMGKFLRRNAAVMIGTFAVFALLLSAGISASVMERRVEGQLADIEQRDKALRADYVRALIGLGEFDAALKYAVRDADIAAATRGVGIQQFKAGNRLAALANFTKSLNAAESWSAAQPKDSSARAAVAAANHWMGQALAANGEQEAARSRLRKALEIYSDLAGSPTVAIRDQTPEAYEEAIEKLTATAP
jgi:eukaryotic-like serine/threonine-protein kinase